jgi:hypothetical protein
MKVELTRQEIIVLRAALCLIDWPTVDRRFGDMERMREGLEEIDEKLARVQDVKEGQ